MRPDYGEGRETTFKRLQRKIDQSLKRKYTSPSLPTTLRPLYLAPTEQLNAPLSLSSTVPFRRDGDFVDRRAS
jgi:hypothetical protein